jgi:2-oxoisovalerate dehydrogenase E1 component
MIELLGIASRTRIVEKLLLEAFSDGLVHGTVHTSIGQEYTAEVLARYLVDGDFVFGTHRAHHHFLAAGGSPESLFAEILGKEKGNTRGLGGTQHLHHGNFFSNGIQGGMVPLAFGASSAIASDKISVAVVGDGTFGQGVVYEVLNWAKIFGGPMLLIVEDNKIAQSTPPEQYIGTALISRVEALAGRFLLPPPWTSRT